MLGVETLKAFQEWRKESPDHTINRDTLIVGMSATADSLEYDRAFHNGMHFFMQKPVQIGILCTILNIMKSSNTLDIAVAALKKSFGGFVVV